MRPDPYAWDIHPEPVAALVILALAYAYAAQRFPPRRWRVACFVGAMLLLAATTLTPLHSLSYHLLTAHLLQNVVLAEWAPALLVLALAPALAARIARRAPLRRLTHPLVALPVWLANYFLWHLPPAYETALRHEALLHLEHALYLVTGVLLWWPVLQDDPWRVPPGARAGYMFAAFLLASPLGLLLALLPDPVYAYYEQPDKPWGLSPLADQQLAGVTMAAEEAVVFFTAFAVFFFRFLAAEEREPAAA